MKTQKFALKTQKYYYGMHSRPFDLGCQPKDARCVQDANLTHPKGLSDFYNIIELDRPLTPMEVRNFELYDFTYERIKEQVFVDAAKEVANIYNIDEKESKGIVSNFIDDLMEKAIKHYNIKSLVKEVYS